MYHDQALIPIKTLAFDHAVNVTLGLPFVRTSPDHGTAFDIAGTGRADPSSLIAAIELAARLSARDQARRAARAPRMSAIDDLPPLREVIRRHDLRAKKSLGQNFLLDLNLTARIARAAGPLDGVTVVEIGPGPGGLTRALLAAGARRVDRDRARRARHRRARGDRRALSRPARRSSPATRSTSIRGRCSAERRRAIVANLPYNIATALLVGWLTAEPWPPWFDRLVLMFQREVAERIAPRPAPRPTAACRCWRWRTEARILFDIARRVRAAAQGDSSLVDCAARAAACDHALQR